MYGSILVPTDGSQESSAVVEEAIELATLCDATIHALHVIDEKAYLSVPDDARDRVRETLKDDADSFTKSVAEKGLDEGVDVVREVRWGSPAPAILSYAVENQVDAIVMGTHGRTGYERFLLGSVAEKVVRTSPVPVLTVAIGDTEEQREEILSVTAPDSTVTVGQHPDAVGAVDDGEDAD